MLTTIGCTLFLTIQSIYTTDECRGVGGIFFDDLDESDVSGLTREQLFQFASVSSYFSLLVVRIDYYYYYCY